MDTSNTVREQADSQGKNLILAANGTQREIAPAQGEVTAGCVVVYTDCTTKTTTSTGLSSGDTFYYGDWNGSSCIRKEYTCP
jgi:hypothetical protein